MDNALAALSPPYTNLRVAVFTLDLMGFVFLAALVITLNISEKVHRSPVFINFMYTWLLYSSFKTFSGLGVYSLMAFKDQTFPQMSPNEQFAAMVVAFDLFVTTLQEALWMITQVSTINLVIHLWFMMKAPLRADPHRGEKRRTALLVMTPYGIGLLPMITLIPSLRLLYAIIAVSVMEVILMIITSVWDILLLVTVWRRRRILKQIDMENVITVSTLIELLAFCLYRLILTPVMIAADIVEAKPIVSISLIAQSFYPLLAFGLLGVGPDVIQVWFPVRAEWRWKPLRISQRSSVDTAVSGFELSATLPSLQGKEP